METIKFGEAARQLMLDANKKESPEVPAGPTMEETMEFSLKCFQGYKPTDEELKPHTDNLKELVAQKHNIPKEDVEDYLTDKARRRKVRERLGIGGPDRKDMCPCGSKLKFRKCCGSLKR